MKKRPFQKKLQKEIFIYSVEMIALVTIILSAILYWFNTTTTRVQLDHTENRIHQLLSSNLNAYEKQIETNRNGVFLDYLKVEADDSDIYGKFYAFNSQQELKSDLMIFDKDMKLQFNSNSKWNNQGVFVNFLLVITERMKEEHTNHVEKIFMDHDKEHYLILTSRIWNLFTLKGYAITIINGKEILSNLNQMQSQYIIADKFNNVFAASSSEFITGPLEKVDTSFFKTRFKYKEDTYYSQTTALTPSLTLTVYQKSLMYPYLLTISIVIVLLITVFMLGFAMLFSRRISLRNAKSLEKLTEEMKKLRKDPNYRLHIHTSDEFEVVSKRINLMLEELSSVHHNNISLLQANLLAERKKLEAQFNPHFLYNTLEVIRASIHFDKDMADQLIIRLNKILRYSINEENPEVKLLTDIVFIQEYLEISKVRFEHFDYKIDLDSACEQIPVPKLFLMPLIENSLKYGFRKRDDLEIIISGKKEADGSFSIQVIDNGNNLTKEKSNRINDNLQNNIPMGNHHGLTNSKKRIQLMYPQAKFNILTQNEQTIIEIRLGV